MDVISGILGAFGILNLCGCLNSIDEVRGRGSNKEEAMINLEYNINHKFPNATLKREHDDYYIVHNQTGEGSRHLSVVGVDYNVEYVYFLRSI
jgi:hypothetical protein